MIVINKDETITGTLSCTPNAKNPRDLDIAIEYRFEGRDGNATERVAYNMK
jgi:protein arginine N-methyltransferase 1